MEIALALVATLALGWWLGRRRRRRRDPGEEAGGFLAGGVLAVLARSTRTSWTVSRSTGTKAPTTNSTSVCPERTIAYALSAS